MRRHFGNPKPMCAHVWWKKMSGPASDLYWIPCNSGWNETKWEGWTRKKCAARIQCMERKRSKQEFCCQWAHYVPRMNVCEYIVIAKTDFRLEPKIIIDMKNCASLKLKPLAGLFGLESADGFSRTTRKWDRSDRHADERQNERAYSSDKREDKYCKHNKVWGNICLAIRCLWKMIMKSQRFASPSLCMCFKFTHCSIYCKISD